MVPPATLPVEAFGFPSKRTKKKPELPPFWEPGTQSGYHAITIGFLATALFKRVEGRTIKQFVSDEFGRLGMNIGLPLSLTHHAATMIAPPSLTSTGLVQDMTDAQFAAIANPPIDPLAPNSDDWRAAD